MAQKRKSDSGERNVRGKSKKQYVDHEASESDRVDGETKLNRPVRGGGDAEEEWVSTFLGEPIPKEKARKRWPHRYNEENEEALPQARHHYERVDVEGHSYSLNDDCSVKGIDGEKDFICRIIELFEAIDGSHYFTAQLYYRACDTVIQSCGNQIDDKYVFFSEDKNDNSLGCLLEKLNILLSPPAELVDDKEFRSTFDYYYDKMYFPAFTSFVSLHIDKNTSGDESSSTICSDGDVDSSCNHGISSNETTLLDLYSGCGAMSTGLCLGANSNGVKLVTKWAVDINQYACDSLRLNHSETQVRNESAEDFLNLLVEWEKLCATFRSPVLNDSSNGHDNSQSQGGDECDDHVDDNEEELDEGEFEVEELYAICYGDPNKNGEAKLHFKVRWKGYGPEYDTWEPVDGLGSCEEKLKEFVLKGYEAMILPLPGTVDVICGGPPCQGISGFNRFRNKDAPLEDPKNNQVLVFMDIVAHLKPKFVLMENVVDIMKFADGFLGRYALARLVNMGYQARMGMMAAGSFGLPQYRMRMFMWGALPTQRLPQFPLPTHYVVKRGGLPTKFEPNRVHYEAGQPSKLKAELLLADAISDLPNVENDESRDAMPYGDDPKTDFQRFIRLPRNEMPGCFESEAVERHQLYDHFPLHLNQDDYERVCQVPKEKGANFRDLPGVQVRADNKVEWDPNVPRKYVSSGKPLVPDYAMTFKKGYSIKPFRRLWWDETVPTVVTRAEPHNQAILHPLQDRVLTIRENARLQGFPDYYQLTGPAKERYIQVGNAVAVPVARALGHSLALALRGLSSAEPVLTLPQDFPHLRNTNIASSPEISSLID